MIHLFITTADIFNISCLYTLFCRQNEGLYIENVVTGRSSSLLFDYCLCRRCAGSFYIVFININIYYRYVILPQFATEKYILLISNDILLFLCDMAIYCRYPGYLFLLLYRLFYTIVF